MNQWQVFQDFNNRGTPMETFLTPAMITRLGTSRIFYIIRASLDPTVIKFGNSTDGHPATRLRDYIVKYGEADDNPPCTGVKLLYCAGTQRNPAVPARQSQVYDYEEYLKRALRNRPNGIVPGRGSERTKVSLTELERTMRLKGQPPEVAVVPRRSARIKVGDIVKYDWDQETVRENGGEAFLGNTLEARVETINPTTYDIKFVVDGWEMRVRKDKVRM
jgi:hypothetical protein